MADYVFSDAERWAVFQTHGGNCYLCGQPIDWQTMQVDHIIPESLYKKPDVLAEHLKSYGLASDFNLNSFENWMPACGRCNNKKKANVFNATPMVQLILQTAAKRAPQAQLAAKEAVTNRKISRALATLKMAADLKELDLKKLEPLIMMFAKSDPDALRALTDRAYDNIREFMKPPELRLAPFFKILFTSGSINIVETPRGTGYVSAHPNPHPSFYCGSCGSNGPWNGARCLSCGMLDDGD